MFLSLQRIVSQLPCENPSERSALFLGHTLLKWPKQKKGMIFTRFHCWILKVFILTLFSGTRVSETRNVTTRPNGCRSLRFILRPAVIRPALSGSNGTDWKETARKTMMSICYPLGFIPVDTNSFCCCLFIAGAGRRDRGNGRTLRLFHIRYGSS